MASPQDLTSAGADALETDVLDLEPTMQIIHPLHEPEPVRHRAGAAGVGMVEGTLASLSGETHDLRRQRIKAAAVALAAIYGLLLVWVYVSDNPGTLAEDGSRLSVRVVLLGLRCLLATAVAGLVTSEAILSHKQLRIIENVLFLGLVGLLMVSQYAWGVELMHRIEGNPDFSSILLAFVKDGVIQMLALMMIYGTIIPNPPAVAARTLLVMFAGPVIAGLLLRLVPGADKTLAHLSAAEEAGSNILFLAIGAFLACYSCFIVNGLRTELHAARKFGQYKLRGKIGSGGMGEVYHAEHELLKRPCALKLIKAEAGSDPIALARFEREVQSAARLSHPNTIAIYDYGHTDDGTFYYVMEYLDGMSLDALVRRAGPLSPGRAIYLLRQVCAGLGEAHAIGLVHRDLKPANIFVARRGGETDVAKVLDFGLVKLTKDAGAAELTAEMTVSGTPSYMAPEQATGKRDLDVRADVYALGSVAYFVLTGQPPFVGESAFAIMMAHARDEVIPPSQIRPDVPADLEAIVLKCLAKKPSDRYPDARAMGRALAACAAASTWDADMADQWWAEAARSAPPKDFQPVREGV
jgi:eukaryotic-like serine/threonine-protein kinase